MFVAFLQKSKKACIKEKFKLTYRLINPFFEEFKRIIMINSYFITIELGGCPQT